MSESSANSTSGFLLANATTFRLGGPCRVFRDCATIDELRRAVEASAGDFLLIGGGSNLLVSDKGYGGDVIRFASASPAVRFEGLDVIVSAATSLDDLARIAVEQGLDGVTCCTGIPGTVGGAIVGNAGAFGEQIGDRVVSVTLMNRSGGLREIDGSACAFAYRSSWLQSSSDVVVAARLRLAEANAGTLAQRRAEILALRAQKHPDWKSTPTAGSFFKNIEPTSKAGRRQAAGWFLEQAGAKELRVGGAKLFEKHANIIVADPGCTAEDVYSLSVEMATRVKTMFNLDLRREVRLVGEFAGS